MNDATADASKLASVHASASRQPQRPAGLTKIKKLSR